METCHSYGPQEGGRSTELCQVLSPLFQQTASSVGVAGNRRGTQQRHVQSQMAPLLNLTKQVKKNDHQCF